MGTLELREPKQVHIIGIGGAGMSAIGAVLATMGHSVSGSDLKDGLALDRLRAMGVEAQVGHFREHVRGGQIVAISTAIGASNVELAQARELGLPVYRRAEVLGALTALKKTVAVAGTHGKTTTSSMLAVILAEAGLDPSFLIGGEVNEIGTNATWADGEWMVVEADESDGTFLELSVEIAIVTSVEPDHLDYYGSVVDLEAAFGRFLSQAGSKSVICADDPAAFELAPAGAVTYGFDDKARLRITNFGGGRSNIYFDLVLDSNELGRFELPLPGEHNARNAAAAVGAATLIGVPMQAAQRALARFAGVARRFEFRGEREGVTFVDDYAHLPTEVRATIAAARRGGWGRIVCVFQPHRYSRTESVAKQFAHAFDEADVVAITDIYPAGELPRPGVSAELIVGAIEAANPAKRVIYLSRRAEVVAFLREELRPGDCCLSLGAGDLTSLPEEMLELEAW